MNDSEGYMPLLIPRKLYPDVITLIASKMSQEAAPDTATPVSKEDTKPIEGLIMSDSVVQYARHDFEIIRDRMASATVMSLLDLTAATPGKEIALSQVIKESGQTRYQVRAQLGGFSKLIIRLLKRKNWPVSHHWNTDESQYYYSMSPQNAALWHSVRAVETVC